jgi:hypothetical protein
MQLRNTPQHGVLFGMTGAGKSVIVADLPDGTWVRIPVDRRRRGLACRTDADARLRADYRESKRVQAAQLWFNFHCFAVERNDLGRVADGLNP